MKNFKTWLLTGSNYVNTKIIFLAPEEDSDYFSLGDRRERTITEKLGIIHLASYLISLGWTFETAKLIDAETIGKICPNAYVGISSHINNYGNALKLAHIAKQSNCKAVILGGPHPTNRAEQIIRNQPDVDYVIVGQGELALEKILSDKAHKGVVEEIHLPLFELPTRERNLWPVGQAEMSGKKMSLAFFSEGCPQTMAGNACLFCSIHHATKYSQRSVDQVVKEMTQLQSLGYESFEITDDDFPRSFGKENLKLLAQEIKNHNLSLNIYIHAGIRSCSREILELLKEIGVVIIQTGLETADLKIKKQSANKSTSKEEQAFFKNCQELEFKLHLSVVFGMTGENKETMEKTCREIENLAEAGLIWAIQADPLLPLPGSKAFNLLCVKYPGFINIDRIDIYKLMQVWFAAFTDIDLEYVIQRRKKLFKKVNPEAIGGLLLKIM